MKPRIFKYILILFPIFILSLSDVDEIKESSVNPISSGSTSNKTAVGTNKTAVGTNKTAVGTNKIAVGTNKTAVGTNKIAVGPKYKNIGDFDLKQLSLNKLNLMKILEKELNRSRAANDSSPVKKAQKYKTEPLPESKVSLGDPKESSKGEMDLKQVYKIRIERLNMMECAIISSLELFEEIVSVTDSGSLDKTIDDVLIKESDLIIEGFQKLVMRAKNDKFLYDDYAASLLNAQIKETLAAAKNTTTLNIKNSKANNLKQKSTHSSNGAKSKEQKANSAQKLGFIPIPIVEETALGNVLKDVTEKADTLESRLKQDKFQEGQQEKGSTIETVVKVGGEEKEKSMHSNDKSPSSDTAKRPVVLIDSANNQYVLSKPGDATAHVEDIVLLQDLLILLLVCCISGMVMYFIGLPVFFGYIIAGTILSKNRLIENAVQVETISRGLGVIFIMFYLGLEFNFTKLGRIWSLSLFGSSLLLAITLLFSCTILPQFLHASMAESFVIGSSVFLSSTAVVVHFLKPGESETNYGRSIMGILLAQDILLGFLLAIMPGLEHSGGLEVAYTAMRLIILSILFTLVSYIIRSPMLQGLTWLYKKSKKSTSLDHTRHQSGPSEVFLLASIGVLLMYIGLGQLFEQSIELSCFVAGMMIANQKNIAESVLSKLEPFKQIFSALFFASIGLHIYPSFLYNEGFLLITLTLIVMLSKALITFFVMVIFRIPVKTSALIGIGLGQISEFTFVLASKAKSKGIVSRELFFILIGITSMSMFLSPFFWSLSKRILGTYHDSGTLPKYRNLEDSAEDEDDEIGRESDLSLRLFEKRTSVLSIHSGDISNDSLPSFKSD